MYEYLLNDELYEVATTQQLYELFEEDFRDEENQDEEDSL